VDLQGHTPRKPLGASPTKLKEAREDTMQSVQCTCGGIPVGAGRVNAGGEGWVGYMEEGDSLGFQETEKRSLLHLLRVRSGWEGEPGKGVRGCGTGRGGGEMTGVPRKAH
jgi:hypothetical protein